MAVHLVIFELPYILVSVCKHFCALAVHFAVLKLAFELAAVWPRHHSSSLHIIVSEFSFIHAACICEIIPAMTVEFSVLKLAFVVASLELEPALSCLLALMELSDVLDAIEIPALSADAMLLVVYPLSLVHIAVHVDENSKPICFPIFPRSLVNITVYMGHPSTSVVETILRLSFINIPIRKLNCAETFPNVHIRGTPLAFVLFHYRLTG